MIDFLRANTWCSQEEYKWAMTVPQVRLASMDFTHVEYISDKKTKRNGRGKRNNETVIGSADDLKRLNDLGLPII